MSILLGKALTVALIVAPAVGLSVAGFRMARRGWAPFFAAFVLAVLWFVVAFTCVVDPHIGKATSRGFPLWYPIGYTGAVAPALATAFGFWKRRRT
jgi:hypothetical protein